MDDELLGARVGAALRELYPEPQSVHLAADLARGRRGHRVAWAVVAAAIVVALAVGLSVFAASRGSGPRPAAGDLRIENQRLVAPFSMGAGVIQLTPVPAGYQPRISYERARQLIFAGPGGQGHAVFLATLAVYPGAGGPPSPADEQVWASAVRGVPQIVFGPPKPGQPINHDYVDIIAVDARTGRDVQQILIGNPIRSRRRLRRASSPAPAATGAVRNFDGRGGRGTRGRGAPNAPRTPARTTTIKCSNRRDAR